MAASKTTTARNYGPGVTVEAYEWGRYLVGDRESLELHPSCPPGMFDGFGETWNTSRTLTLPDGRSASVRKIGRRFRMADELPTTQVDWREQAAPPRDIEEAQRPLSGVPLSDAAYRAAGLTLVDGMAHCIRLAAAGTVVGKRCGFSLADEARDEVERALWTLREVFTEGRVVQDVSQRQRQRVADEVLHLMREANPTLAKLLSDLSDGTRSA